MLARRRSSRAVAPLAIAVVALALPGAAASSSEHVEVIAGGLDNPRGLTVHGDHVYVAEAGRGGPGPCIEFPEGGSTCLGATGSITRVDTDGHGTVAVVDGLPSLAPQQDDPSAGIRAGGDAIGPSDVIARGDRLVFTVGLAAAPAARDTLGPGGAALAKLWAYDLDDEELSERADIAAYEAAANPDGGELDTNPNSVAAHRGLKAVADAGGNSLLGVRRGAVSTLAAFPPTARVPAPFPGAPDPFPVQPVPTSVVRGPGGDWFVGQLTGFPFPAGAAEVYRVPRGGGEPEVYASGFTTILDLAFDEDGALYVLQATRDGLTAPPSPGVLWRVEDGRREEIAAGELAFPTGLALDRDDDTAYVSNRGNEAGTGEVVAIHLDD
jgi:hypothetical protein